MLFALPGKSQSVLVRASNGLLYVVKLLAGLNAPFALSNEILGTELARYLGLSVPNWTLIELTEDWFRRSFANWPGPEGWGIRPHPGIYFASRGLGHGYEEEILEVLPDLWFDTVTNRNDFIGMLILDLWTNRAGQRKALFVPGPEKGKYTALFGDNLQMFGGPWADAQQKVGDVLFHDHRIYWALDFERECNWWLGRIGSIDPSIVMRLARSIPSQWIDLNHIEQIRILLGARQNRLEDLLAREIRSMTGSGDSQAW